MIVCKHGCDVSDSRTYSVFIIASSKHLEVWENSRKLCKCLHNEFSEPNHEFSLPSRLDEAV